MLTRARRQSIRCVSGIFVWNWMISVFGCLTLTAEESVWKRPRSQLANLHGCSKHSPRGSLLSLQLTLQTVNYE
jgi:hypothetical protein